ncbi:hypothetical protein E4L95_11185 [Paracoccus liaowanqingii]|uniref:Uncharacterized protein n=1 Tax=Paracoccus liaowanqingii TaxID=2560053 RepID=A0A4Z1BVA0_9RHOB|nr:hypothetical protein [Paracoccus liaowanqingii]QDA36699.1 hypothetical protein E4191_21700 [Paracoccus liaowanqingii]TGN59757.1 hypothetical protein E4L95_11185 [Paracoccus liaowanqingii]
MIHPTAPECGEPSPVLARASFTLAMLQNLVVIFEAAAENHPIVIEMTAGEVWAVTPDGTRLSIGVTTLPPPTDA